MAYRNLSFIISWEEYCGSFTINMHVSALMYLLSGGPARKMKQDLSCWLWKWTR